MVDVAVPTVMEYNYEHFGEPSRTEDPGIFKQVNPVGTVAPDFPAVRLRDLANARLSDYLGKGFVVVEFGSVT